MRLKLFAVPWMSAIVRFSDENTPMPSRIIHSTATMTTNAMPIATLTRNDIFMTDHGSTRATVRRTRRPVAGAGAAGRGGAAPFFAAVAGPAPAHPAAPAQPAPRPGGAG